MAAKKAAPTKEFDEEFDDSDEIGDGDDDSASADLPEGPAYRGRDWRDIERYREDRALRALIDDDLYFDKDD